MTSKESILQSVLQQEMDKRSRRKSYSLRAFARDLEISPATLSRILAGKSITMSIDPSRLPEARKRIASFRRNLSKYLDKGNKKEVFVLLFSLFPISIPKK